MANPDCRAQGKRLMVDGRCNQPYTSIMNLREFIRSRESEIKAEMAKLRAELAELQAARQAIDGASGEAGTAHEADGPRRLTQRDMIQQALDARPEGGTSDRIAEWVNEAHGIDMSRSTASSQLSRMGGEGAVVLDKSTKIWRSAKHARRNGDVGLPLNENAPPFSEGGADTEEGDASSGERQPAYADGGIEPARAAQPGEPYGSR